MAAVLVHIDLDGDRPHGSSLAALAAGRRIASSWGATLYAAVLVADSHTDREPPEAPPAAASAEILHVVDPTIAALRVQLASAGADKLVLARCQAPVAPLWSHLGSAWQAVVVHLRPRLVLFGARAPAADELGARTGAAIGARLLAHARAIDGELVELRCGGGTVARASDGGAAVALIAGAAPVPAAASSLAGASIEVFGLTVAGAPDARVELVGEPTPAPADAIVWVAADASPAVRDSADRLARAVDGSVLAAPPDDAVAPALCVTLGTADVDVAGASELIAIDATAATELVRRLGPA